MKANATTALKTAVANAVKSTLSTGSGSKLLQVYSGTIPATAGAAITTQVKLLEFTIDPGSWAVTAGELVVPASSAINALATGVARWARFVDGDASAVLDVDVTTTGGNGFIRLTTTNVVAGAPCSIVTGSIKV